MGKEQLDLELLIKMLKMSRSDNDNQALVAIRKANAALDRVGEDWDTLIRGKITIIEDPFTSVAAPKSKHQTPPPKTASYNQPEEDDDPYQPTAPRQKPSRPQAAPYKPAPSQGYAPKVGERRYNATIGLHEVWDGSGWLNQSSPPPPPNPFAGMSPIGGNTYPVKEELKNIGAKWDAQKKIWMVPDSRMKDAQDIMKKAPPSSKWDRFRNQPKSVDDLLES